MRVRVGLSTNIQIFLRIWWIREFGEFRKYSDIFWLSPMMSSLFSLDNTQFYARNNRIQQFPTWKMYFINFISLEALKPQFFEIAYPDNIWAPDCQGLFIWARSTGLARLPGRICCLFIWEISARSTGMKFKKQNQNSET